MTRYDADTKVRKMRTGKSKNKGIKVQQQKRILRKRILRSKVMRLLNEKLITQSVRYFRTIRKIDEMRQNKEQEQIQYYDKFRNTRNQKFLKRPMVFSKQDKYHLKNPPGSLLPKMNQSQTSIRTQKNRWYPKYSDVAGSIKGNLQRLQRTVKPPVNKVQILCQYLTIDEILDIGEDPTYFLGNSKYNKDPSLLNGKLWDKEAESLHIRLSQLQL